MAVTIKFESDSYSGRFDLDSKFTFIVGDSGTGKSEILQRQWKDLHLTKFDLPFGYRLVKLPVSSYPERTPRELFGTLQSDAGDNGEKTIFYGDEGPGLGYLYHPEYQKVLQETPYLYLIASREPFPGLAYSYKSVKHLVMSGTKRNPFYSLECVYDDYSKAPEDEDNKFTKVMLEDKKSGYPLFEKIVTNIGTTDGKDNIAQCITDAAECTLFIADAAGIGSSIDECIENLNQRSQDCGLLLIESFEHMILNSRFIKGQIDDMIDSDSPKKKKLNAEFYSRLYPPINTRNVEKYFEYVLDWFLRESGIHSTKNTSMRNELGYSKSKLHPCFEEDCCHIAEASCNFRMPGDKTELLIDGSILKALRKIQQNYEEKLLRISAENQEANDAKSQKVAFAETPTESLNDNSSDVRTNTNAKPESFDDVEICFSDWGSPF